MIAELQDPAFARPNRGYRSKFRLGKLSLGLVIPIERYPTSPVPMLDRHIERVQLAEALGFSSV